MSTLILSKFYQGMITARKFDEKLFELSLIRLGLVKIGIITA